ncbi:MAG TPA: dienelactone hydrolase family protein [Povalibacter sp.]
MRAHQVLAVGLSLIDVVFSSAALADLPNPEVRVITAELIGEPPSGTFGVVIEQDASLGTHTIYRPKRFGSIRHPLLVWGNGGCQKTGLGFAEFLAEIASHGVFVIADGPPVKGDTRREPPANGPPPRPSPGSLKPDGTALIPALDWIEAQNARAGSRYEGKIDMSRIAAMGMSCGGLMAYGASGDRRVTSVGIWNSGLLEPNAPIFDSLHSPVLIVTGGSQDVAYANGLRDFQTLPARVPVVHAVYPGTGHGGTYAQDNGGPFGAVALAWLKWTLFGDDTVSGKGFFVGEHCELCTDAGWVVQRRSLP